MQFFQFCADLSKKSKCIKTIYIYTSERSRCTLSENGIVYHALIYCFGDIRVWSQRTLLNFWRVSIFFDILIASIFWTVAQTPINHTIFWKGVMRTYRCRNRTIFPWTIPTKNNCPPDNYHPHNSHLGKLHPGNFLLG